MVVRRPGAQTPDGKVSARRLGASQEARCRAGCSLESLHHKIHLRRLHEAAAGATNAVDEVGSSSVVALRYRRAGCGRLFAELGTALSECQECLGLHLDRWRPPHCTADAPPGRRIGRWCTRRCSGPHHCAAAAAAAADAAGRSRRCLQKRPTHRCRCARGRCNSPAASSDSSRGGRGASWRGQGSRAGRPLAKLTESAARRLLPKWGVWHRSGLAAT
mmetsp:Transcript_81349/g.263966  ORF Transcript_81349/g.263966 Transcript_81349/m.263966 type:complete len:218 (-) Transcript_81349:802-1455(-)